MISIIDQFSSKLVWKEIKGRIKASSALVKDSSNQDLNNPDFPEAMNDFYKQVDLINIHWMISTKEKGEELKNQLKQDPWLKERFWDNGSDIKILDEYLSGFINIQKLEDMLNPEFCEDEAYYSTIDSFIDGQNANDYLPFDIHWTLTACLKRENGKILDNVWIVDSQGEKMFDMDVTIEKYLELCYKAKGFYYWPLVYCTRNQELDQDEDFYRELMKRFLPMLFPHLELDLSDFGIES